MLQQISIKPFESKDQEAVRSLILAGLAEHWGQVDPALNPDLNDMAASYRNATFLVAWLDGRIIGCGALVPRSDQTAEIVRMSVASECRRQGIGRAILARLCQEARQSGHRRIVLETTATWDGVIRFYERFGFRVTHRRDGRSGGEVHFALEEP
ncbi:MAG: GNAT family N-acetyltransferase [Gemmatimonadaceae bacterium]|nr:GNAT family N-acetyltransferase [Gemmatimonadaceae bacterium]